jgi:hypothetical protein
MLYGHSRADSLEAEVLCHLTEQGAAVNRYTPSLLKVTAAVLNLLTCVPVLDLNRLQKSNKRFILFGIHYVQSQSP